MPPNAAVIGTNWGRRMHVPSLREAGWRVKLICGRDEHRTREAALQEGIDEFTTDLSAVAGSGVDLVVLATGWQERDATLETFKSNGQALLVEQPVPASILCVNHDAPCTRRANLASRYLDVYMEMFERTAPLRRGDVHAEIFHRITIPPDEEDAWTPLLAVHAIDAVWHLAGDAQWNGDLSGRGTWCPVSDCPSWSWPLYRRDDDHLSIFELVADGVFYTESGSELHYNLSIRHGQDRRFLETVDLQLQGARHGYALSLDRQDEHSPWVSSPLIDLPQPINSDGAVNILADAVSSQSHRIGSRVEDIWFKAHRRQARAIRDEIFNSPAPSCRVRPASVSDAYAVQMLLQAGIDGRPTGHAVADGHREGRTIAKWSIR